MVEWEPGRTRSPRRNELLHAIREGQQDFDGLWRQVGEHPEAGCRSKPRKDGYP